MHAIGARRVTAAVDAMYRLGGTDREWRAGVLAAVRAELDFGAGVYTLGAQIGADRAYTTPVTAQLGVDPDYFARREDMTAFRASLGATLARRATFSCTLATFAADAPERTSYLAAMRGTSNCDLFFFYAQDGAGGGVVVGAPAPRAVSAHPRVRALWERAGVHFAAAARLRARVGRGVRPAALLALDGAVVDASAPIDRAARAQLAAAARLRGRAGATADAGDALRIWRGLAAGRWSLVDTWEQGGARYLAAFDNRVPDPRRLTATETAVLARAADAASNKAIAFDLELAESTVAAALAQLYRKLRCAGRTELVALARAADTGRLRHHARAGGVAILRVEPAADRAQLARLSPAEAAVALAASRGASNRAIAAERGTSVRTVANQLRGVFDKLGVHGRAELVRALDAPP